MNVELDVIFTIMILEKKDKCVGVFRPFWWRKFPLEGFSHSWKVEYAKLVLPRISLLTSCTNKPQSYTLHVVECHTIKNLKPICDSHAIPTWESQKWRFVHLHLYLLGAHVSCRYLNRVVSLFSRGKGVSWVVCHWPMI
jgi:hypothetical protein